ncbi:collagen alpha-6(VI) chain-like [Hyperolius riggenbachi]|uniref:collagen alpha-6(VI) chain-like n=1 Tax=Hyperolius riggenbachi TaxID=752182 RepID=UPI0035A32E03
MIRDTCRKPTCPAYPTELVFALDAASGMTQAIYTRMIEMVTYMLSRITIRESNCPVGARVAVVAYDTYTNYLIRFYDFHSQEKLLTAVKNIPLKMSSRSRNIGNSMRFVARNIFKRSLQSSTARKIAVFFSNGPSKDVDAINTAVMEYKALGIIPAVITFNPVPAITQAFSMDDTGTFLTMNIPRSGDYKPSIDTLQACTVCLDTCKPDPQCLTNTLTLERKPMDIAFLLDSSYSMKQDDFEAAKGFISTMIDQLDVSSKGDRVAVVSNTPFGFRPNSEEKPHLEFDLTTYDDSLLMKKHLQENTGHLRGPLALGFTLQWTVENVLSTAPDLRKHKAIILIVSGETSSWDKETLSEASLSAKCKGYPLFVIFTGKTYNDTELIDLPSIPIDQHLLQLGRIHKPDFGYAVGFMKCFINSIRRSINKYPSPQLKCSASGSLRGKRLTLHEGDLRSDLLHHSSLNWMSTDDSGDNKMEAVTSTQHTYVTSLSPHNEQGSSNFSGKPEER